MCSLGLGDGDTNEAIDIFVKQKYVITAKDVRYLVGHPDALMKILRKFKDVPNSVNFGSVDKQGQTIFKIISTKFSKEHRLEALEALHAVSTQDVR